MKKYRVIAIDGPAGSGKSSTARLLAGMLGFTFLDTGAMYRSVTLAAIQKNIDLCDEKKVCEVASAVEIAIVPGDKEDTLMLDGQDVTWKIREPKVDAGVSLVSSYSGVRKEMVKIQREFARERDIVAEGRDMGTVVFPEADLKIYLVADLEARAIRRCRQLEGAGIGTSVDDLMASLASRDLFDSGRDHSPLRKAAGAIELDTTNMSLNEQVEKVYELACRKLGIS